MQAIKTKVQVSLDPTTLEGLDFIVQNTPDIESRSAAIRWATRHGVESIKAAKQDAAKEKP